MSYVLESNIRVKCYDHSNFSRSSVVKFWASRWVMSPNRTSGWKVMTIRISRELPLLNFERLDELCPRIEYPSEQLWAFEFLENFRCSISSVSIYYLPKSEIRVKTLWPFEFLESFRCSISSVLIYYVPESDIRVNFYDDSNFLWASVVPFRASRWVMSANWSSCE